MITNKKEIEEIFNSAIKDSITSGTDFERLKDIFLLIEEYYIDDQDWYYGICRCFIFQNDFRNALKYLEIGRKRIKDSILLERLNSQLLYWKRDYINAYESALTINDIILKKFEETKSEEDKKTTEMYFDIYYELVRSITNIYPFVNNENPEKSVFHEKFENYDDNLNKDLRDEDYISAEVNFEKYLKERYNFIILNLNAVLVKISNPNMSKKTLNILKDKIIDIFKNHFEDQIMFLTSFIFKNNKNKNILEIYFTYFGKNSEEALKLELSKLLSNDELPKNIGVEFINNM